MFCTGNDKVRGGGGGEQKENAHAQLLRVRYTRQPVCACFDPQLHPLRHCILESAAQSELNADDIWDEIHSLGEGGCDPRGLAKRDPAVK